MKRNSILILGILLLNILNAVISAGESDFAGISLSKSFKDLKNHNPCLTQKFSADPGVMEYNGRVYSICIWNK